MKITLEKWEYEDYIDFYNASNDIRIYENMSDNFPKTLEECRKTVKFFSDSRDITECIRSIRIDGETVGCIAAFFGSDMYSKNAELAYWLSEKYRGRGVMTFAVNEFTQILFSDFQIHRLFARPFERNKASHRVLQKSGFQYEGILIENVLKNGEFLNSCLFAKIDKL